MGIEIVEFRRMLNMGKDYLAGVVGLHELNGSIAYCLDAAKFWHGHKALIEVVLEWQAMVERRWNEFGHHSDPLSESDFSLWLAAQISSQDKDHAPNCAPHRTPGRHCGVNQTLLARRR